MVGGGGRAFVVSVSWWSLSARALDTAYLALNVRGGTKDNFFKYVYYIVSHILFRPNHRI